MSEESGKFDCTFVISETQNANAFLRSSEAKGLVARAVASQKIG